LYPRHNRIISGLCLDVVVVEAAPRSGSLSTANHAMEQNREVFAVLSPVDSIACRASHRLMRDGARLVETVDDILEELGPLVREVSTADDKPRCVTPPSWPFPIRSAPFWASFRASRAASKS
jgi:DNA processing protein